MNSFWQKLKMWTKVVVFGLLGLYTIIFLSMNWNVKVQGILDFVFIKYENPRILNVLLVTAIASVIGWWLLRALFSTVRQVRENRKRNFERNRTSRLEKEIAEIKRGVGGGATPAREKPVATDPEAE